RARFKRASRSGAIRGRSGWIWAQKRVLCPNAQAWSRALELVQFGRVPAGYVAHLAKGLAHRVGVCLVPGREEPLQRRIELCLLLEGGGILSGPAFPRFLVIAKRQPKRLRELQVAEHGVEVQAWIGRAVQLGLDAF